MSPVMLIIFWFVWSFVNGFIAEEKGRSSVWSIASSLVFSPVIVYAYLLAVPALPKK